MLNLFLSKSIISIPVKKVLVSIEGIGKKKLIFILKETSILGSVNINSFTEKQILKLVFWLDSMFLNSCDFGLVLLAKQKEQKMKLIKIKHFKGLCYKNNLPVRGQRTQTNSKTARKKNFI